MAHIELHGVRKTLKGEKGARFTIGDLDFDIPEGRVTAVLGPSGCGKSTLLRIIAGLIVPDSGSVLFDGESFDEIPPGGRKIGMVFQDYALYPNYSSRENVLSYFLFRKKTPELDAEAQAKYRRTAELMGVELEKLMDRMPKGLSGGERQRVAIGRCITRDPKVFLLDEPFSNLDQKLREKYRVQLRALLRQFDVTTVYVTHDQAEALILADRIAIMRDGRIEQVGAPEEIYREPKSLFVADFLNLEPETPAINLLEGALVSKALEDYTIGIRPEDLSIAPLGETSSHNVSISEAPSPASGLGPLTLQAEVVEARHLPLRNKAALRLRAVGQELSLSVDETAAADCEPGSKFTVMARRYHLFDRDSGLRERTVGD
jgi:ABC-type sugar transport systems, ATPase components